VSNIKIVQGSSAKGTGDIYDHMLQKIVIIAITLLGFSKTVAYTFWRSIK
jgi:hypothetical protein